MFLFWKLASALSLPRMLYNTLDSLTICFIFVIQNSQMIFLYKTMCYYCFSSSMIKNGRTRLYVLLECNLIMCQPSIIFRSKNYVNGKCIALFLSSFVVLLVYIKSNIHWFIKSRCIRNTKIKSHAYYWLTYSIKIKHNHLQHY